MTCADANIISAVFAASEFHSMKGAKYEMPMCFLFIVEASCLSRF